MASIVSLYRELGKDCVKLDLKEREALEEFSKNYEVVNYEYEAILSVCKPGEEFHSSFEIANAVKYQSNLPINVKKLSQGMKILGFKPARKRINGKQCRGWLVKLFGASPFDGDKDF